MMMMMMMVMVMITMIMKIMMMTIMMMTTMKTLTIMTTRRHRLENVTVLHKPFTCTMYLVYAVAHGQGRIASPSYIMDPTSHRTHINFVSNQLTYPFRRYDYLENLTLKIKVKVYE